MGQIKFANNAVSRLVGPLTTSSASLTVTPGDGALFPALAAGDWYMATLIRADGAREIVKVTSRTVDAMSILRAQEGTAALAFNPNDRIEARITSGAMGEFPQRAEAKALGASGGRYGMVLDASGNVVLTSAHAGWLLYASGTNTVITLPDLTTMEQGQTITVQFTQNSGSVSVATVAGQVIISGLGAGANALAIPQGSVVKLVAGDAPYWFASVPTPVGTNGFGRRTVSTAAPSGGVDGDIWYQV